MTILLLPIPPTTNHLFATGRHGRRFRTAEYEAWIKEAGWILASQRPPCFDGRVSIAIEVRDPPTNKLEDCCNREKASIDLLVRHGVIKSDSQHHVRMVTIGWASDLADQVRITIRPWKE